MLTLTDAAIENVKRKLTARGRGCGIKIGVKRTGCNGYSYVLEYVDTPISDDIVEPYEDFSLYIDPDSVPFINGMTVDYVRQGLNEGFEFRNELERARCGCGESFTV